MGVPGAIAPGNGRPSILALRIISSVSAPPAELPKIAMFFGLVVIDNAL